MKIQPGGGRRRRRSCRPSLEGLESRKLLATFFVSQTADSGPGTLRQAMLNANLNPGPDFIEFGIPTSTSPNLDVPFPGFDPFTQTWRIQLTSPLPVVTEQVTIDGFSQADVLVAYRYPMDTDEPTQFQTVPNSIPALDGNNAQLRVIIDGSTINRGTNPDPIGFELDTSNSDLRGFIIDGFETGVLVPNQGNTGNRIQGNSIGGHFLYPVDLQTGDPLPRRTMYSSPGSGFRGTGS